MEQAEFDSLLESLKKTFVIAAKAYLMSLNGSWIFKALMSPIFDWAIEKISQWDVIHTLLESKIKIDPSVRSMNNGPSLNAAYYKSLIKQKNETSKIKNPSEYASLEKAEISVFTRIVS